MAGLALGAGLGLGPGGGAARLSPTIVLLSGFEGVDGSTSFTDESSFARTLTAQGNAQVDTAQFKFGTSSLLCDGTGDAVTAVDSNDLDFGSGSWTVEFFVRFASIPTFGPFLFSKVPVGGASGFYFDYQGTGSSEFRLTTSGHATRLFADTLTTATWYHVCVEYDSASTTTRVYRDGVMRGSKFVAARTIIDDTEPFYIGGRFDGGSNLNGWIDEFRLTKGVAQYNSDGGFTVPTAAYPRS